MPVVSGLTRLEIETAVGYNLAAIFSGSWTSGGSTTENTDTKIKAPADGSNGKWLHATSGDESGEIVRVTDDDGSGVLTHDALTTSPSAADTYLLWESRFPPAAIHDFITQAIRLLYGRSYNPVEDITLFADGNQRRFTTPTGISMIRSLEYRTKDGGRVIDSADAAWTAGSNVTVAVDSKLAKRGKSNKLTIGAVSAGDIIASRDFTAINLSDFTHVEWWARASFTTTAADYKLLLSATSGAASAIELLEFPVLTADTWTPIRVALAKADEDTAIIAVGVEDERGDNDNQTLWIDDIRATHNDRGEWLPIPSRLWSVDKSARDIVFTESARQLAGYSRLKLIGGDEPLELAADTDVNEVSDEFVIAKATALALSAMGEFNERTERQIAMWEARAAQAYRRIGFLTNVREVE
jgi:hypothetical protein